MLVNRRKKIILVLTILLSLSSCAAVSDEGNKRNSDDTYEENNSEISDANTRKVTNIDGTVISVPENWQPERIAAVYGPSYETAVVLGVEDKIAVCADVQFENFPWALKIFKDMSKLPYLKNVHSSVNFEELQRYSPDLVLTFNRPNELKQLKRAGITAINGTTTSDFSDIKDELVVYADVLGGTAPERAKKYADYFDEKIKMVKDVVSSIPEDEIPTVYYAGIDLLTTYGKYSDLNEVIETAGGKSVTSELDAGNHTQINFEQLAKWNPDYIFIDHGGMNDKASVEKIKSDAENSSKYKALTAVNKDEIYLTPSGVFYWDMGLQKILLVMYMAKVLHPNEFADLDMREELCDFYSEFYGYELSMQEAEMILEREDPK